jgi:hypothetical protein
VVRSQQCQQPAIGARSDRNIPKHPAHRPPLSRSWPLIVYSMHGAILECGDRASIWPFGSRHSVMSDDRWPNLASLADESHGTKWEAFAFLPPEASQIGVCNGAENT